MGRNEFQTIVVGAGAIGSAAAYWLAERGQQDVLLLEQFELGHGMGASNDHSRIIRHSYHSNVYGRLTQDSYDNWDRLVSESGQPVITRTGGLDIAEIGTPGVASVEGYRKVLGDNGHAFEVLDTAALKERFPQFIFDVNVTATYQAETGLIDIRRAVQTHLAMAAGLGVVVQDRTPVRRLESVDGGVLVHTDGDTYRAAQVVVATASWCDDLLRPLGATWTTTISQEQVVYLVPKRLKDFSVGTFPVWVVHGENLVYGFPTYGEAAIKVARDVTGRFVTQQTRTHEPILEENQLLEDFVSRHLPTGFATELYAKTCIYDMPPDRDFVVDRMPGHPNIVLGLGAGHAGKFAGLLGEILAELVVDGRSTRPVYDFRADRPALTDPAYQPVFMLYG